LYICIYNYTKSCLSNYTLTKSSANLPDRADSILPGQSGSVGNLALTYEKYGFTARFGVNYHGKYIWAVGEDEDSDIYYDSRMQFDFSASQPMHSGFLKGKVSRATPTLIDCSR